MQQLIELIEMVKKNNNTAINKGKGSLEQIECNSFISKQMQNAILIQL